MSHQSQKTNDSGFLEERIQFLRDKSGLENEDEIQILAICWQRKTFSDAVKNKEVTYSVDYLTKDIAPKIFLKVAQNFEILGKVDKNNIAGILEFLFQKEQQNTLSKPTQISLENSPERPIHIKLVGSDQNESEFAHLTNDIQKTSSASLIENNLNGHRKPLKFGEIDSAKRLWGKTHFLGIPNKLINVDDSFVSTRLKSANSKDIIEISKDSISTLHKQLTSFYSDNSCKKLHLLVHGISGIGKTRLLRYLALKCSQSEFLGDCLPILVNLADLRYIEQGSNLIKYRDLSSYIFDESYKVTVGQKEDLDKALLTGKALMLLDGLEIGTQDDNTQVLQEVYEFVGRYFHCHFIITCNNLKQYPRLDSFEQLEISLLENDQISDFIRVWFMHKTGQKKDGDVLINEIEKEASNNIPFTPMVLSFICLKFAQRGNLQQKTKNDNNLVWLYREAIFAMLDPWDNQREHQCKIYKELPTRYKEDLIGEIALESLKYRKLELPLSLIDVTISRFLLPLLSTLTSQQNPQNHHVEGIVQSIEIQDGLLIGREDRDGSYYRFTHEVIRNYFASLAISRKNWDQWQKLFDDYGVNDLVEWERIFSEARKLLSYRTDELAQFMTENKIVGLAKPEIL